ncbi:MAG: ABC transporter permease [Dehalococcoidia bacterium]|nr:ABC transporter permease [Dehalococcoidia bacterium]
MAIAESAELFQVEHARPREQRRWLRVLLGKKLAMCALAYLAVFYLAGIFAPLVATHDPTKTEISVEARLAGSSSEHWFGTDRLGRDIYSRVVYAARTTIIFTFAVLITGGVFLGLGLGLLAGYRGGWIDTAIMRVGEILAGLPTLIMMLAITAAFRTHINNLSFDLADATWLSVDEARTLVKFVIIVGATVPFAWVGSARIVRSQALAIRELPYVTAAEAAGASTPRILARHIFPGVLPLFVVGLSAGMAGIAGAEVGLSFLGLGIDPPTSSFGNLISEGAGARFFEQFPHVLIFSSLPVIFFFFAWNLLGDALVDILEPRANQR